MNVDSVPAATCDLCGAREAAFLLEKGGAQYVRCRGCGFIFTHPRNFDSLTENNEAYEDRIDRYAQKFSSSKSRRSAQAVLRMFAPYRQTGRLLEIGSNTGAFLYHAREQGWQPVGVEPTEGCARYGREKHGLEILTGIIEEVSLPENSFDAVYSNAVFEHLPNPSTAFRAAFRALRPGGALYVDTVNYDSYTREFIGAEWKLIEPRGHLSLYTPATLRRYCEQAGFEAAQITTHGVRLRPNSAGRLKGFAKWSEEMKKAPYALMCRWTLKGDSISALARKPKSRG